MVSIKDYENNEVKIFYKDNEIGKCKSLLSFNDLRYQIAKEYKDKKDFNIGEYSDYSFEYKGYRFPFKKNGSYFINKNISFWEDELNDILTKLIHLNFE